MPAYIAGRFNLLIREVYRGLLVGTSPLVDPGFEEYLSVPIHNFTDNIYLFKAGESAVYFEFTKLIGPSYKLTCPALLVSRSRSPSTLVSCQQAKTTNYRRLSNRGHGWPACAKRNRRRNQKNYRNSKTTESRLQLFGLAAAAGVAALIITALALGFASYDVFSSARRFVDDVALRQDEGNLTTGTC